MIQANINNRWAQLSQNEKAELLGIYASQGWHDLANIIAHYNSCGGKLYADGGPGEDGKLSKLKDRIRQKAVDYYYSHNVKPAIDKYGIDEVRLRLYDHISPFSYDNADIRVEKALSTPHLGGTDRKGAGEDIRFSDARFRDDIWRTYLGVPEDKAHIEGWNPDRVVESKYKPTIGGDKEKYYTINQESQYYAPWSKQKEGLFGGGKDEELVNMVLTGEPELPYTADSAWPMRYGETRQSDILGRYFGDHAVSRGIDPNRGDYVSFYDLWDISPSEGNNRKGGPDESHGIGTPIPFYDRLYLDDYFGVNSKPQNPDEFYGGYLTPAIINSSDYSSGGKIHIKPENRGKFTALKKRTGHSASWFKAHGTPAQKKMATFALNARKWKHEDGGPEKFSVRDNTRISFIPQNVGYIPAIERPVIDRSDIRLDDGINGYLPVIGDVLQGGQAVTDFFSGDYGKAAIGTGLLFLPNIIEKAGKAGVKLLRNSNIRSVSDLYNAAERVIARGNARNKFLNTEFMDYPEFAEFLQRTGLEPSQEAVDQFAKLQGTSVRGTLVPTLGPRRTAEDLKKYVNSLSPEERSKLTMFDYMGFFDSQKKLSQEEISKIGDFYLTHSPYHKDAESIKNMAAKNMMGADALSSNGIYSSNSLAVANDNASLDLPLKVLGENKGYIGEINIPLEYNKSLPIENQLDQINSQIFNYDDISSGLHIFGMNGDIGSAAEKVGYKIGDNKYTEYIDGSPIYERTTLGPDQTAQLLRKIDAWDVPQVEYNRYGLKPQKRMPEDNNYFIPKITTERDLEKTADLLSWLTNSYGDPIFASGGPLAITSQYIRTPKVETMGTLNMDLSMPEAKIETPMSFDLAPELYNMVPLMYDIPTVTTMYPQSEPNDVDLFSNEAIARRALKQRYAESSFNDKAVSKAGAQGAWQIMPITLKDYMGRGRGKAGDLNDPAYNRQVRDWVMKIIPRDLQDLYSESDSDKVKLAKIYGAYNWGAGNMRKYLRKKRDAGEDISNSVDWVEGLNPETKRYIKYLAFDEDIPDTVYTNKAFEEAAAKKGFSFGGKVKTKEIQKFADFSGFF